MRVTLIEDHFGYGAENPFEPTATGPWLTSRITAWRHVVLRIGDRVVRSPGYVPADERSAHEHRQGLIEMAMAAADLDELIEIGWLEDYWN